MNNKKYMIMAGIVVGAFATGAAVATLVSKIKSISKEQKLFEEFLESLGYIPEDSVEEFLKELNEDFE